MIDEAPGWERKIDHRLRALWARVPELDRALYEIRVFVRFTRSGDLLRGLGVQVHSVVGDIASGSMMLADLPRVAGVAEILFVELAQPLQHDS